MKSRRTTLIVAVVLAVATGILTLRYLSSLNQQAQQHVAAMRPIIIANVDIPARSKIKAVMLTKVMKPETEVEPGAISNPKDAEGDVSLVSIAAGSAIVQSKIGVPAAVGVTGRLKVGQRAVSIPVDMVKSVSGLIEPGDRVDVMASVGAANGGKTPRTVAIIRGATVLAVDSAIEPNAQASGAPSAPAGQAPATVTLAVSAAQANLLTVADLNANLRLALRSPEEAVGSLPAQSIDLEAPAPATAPQSAPAQPASPAQAAPAAAPAVRAPSAGGGIPVIDGDRVTMNDK